MKQPLRRVNTLLLLLLGTSGMNLRAAAQVSSVPANIRPSGTVLLEARVVGIPSSEFRELGVIFPESADVLDGPLGFAVVLPDSDVQALVRHPRATSVHSLKLQGAAGNALKFRVDSRVPVNGTMTAADPAYFELGMIFEVTPEIFAGRRVALSSSSLTQVRRGQFGGGLAPVVFETAPIKHNIQIPEGKTILLGGFLTASNSEGLPPIPSVSGNPLLGYVATKSPRKGNDPEIVVLLTPRILGTIEETGPATTISALPQPAPPPTSNPMPTSSAIVPAANVALKPDIPVPAPVSPPPPAAPPAPRKESRFYTVQVGAFGSSANADALVSELKPKFEGVFIDEAPGVNTPFRVRVGRLSTLAAARRIQSQLKAQGFDSYIVTPGTP